MPTLNNHQSSRTVKALLMADSGTGKTGALVSLVKAGYRLVIQDFDNGLDILANLVRDECPDKADNVIFETLTDKMRTLNGQAVVDGVPKAWQRAMGLLDKWKTEDIEIGGISSWDSNTIYVADSLTMAAQAAMRYVLAVNGRLNVRPYESDWGEAQNQIERWLQLLYSDAVKCNVLVLAHVNFTEISVDSGRKDEKGKPIMDVLMTKGLPMAVGRALSPKIPRYFNNVLLMERRGGGKAVTRKILTTPQGITEAKCASTKIPAELPIATGLADFFSLVRGDAKP